MYEKILCFIHNKRNPNFKKKREKLQLKIHGYATRPYSKTGKELKIR